MSRAANRPTRTPIHQRNKITVANQDPNKKIRWVRDEDDRIEIFKEAGYTLAKPTKVGDNRADASSQLGSVVERPAGGGKRLVLMEIDRDLYEQDQRDKEKELRRIEADLNPKVPEAQRAAFYGGAQLKSEHRQKIQTLGDDE